MDRFREYQYFMKKIIITQSNYIPWKGYFDGINLVDELILYDDMQYTKRDWRNRNQIQTKEGLAWLSIPVEVKGKFSQKISETRISEENWANKHWQTLWHNYKKAPFFDLYAEAIEKQYKQPYVFLSEVNRAFIELINSFLGITTPIRWSSEFELAEERNERLIHICRQTQASDYYSGPAAQAYMDMEAFTQAGLKVHWFKYGGYPEYPQLYQPFSHSVTILDLLFNTGPEAPQYMKSFRNPEDLTIGA